MARVARAVIAVGALALTGCGQGGADFEALGETRYQVLPPYGGTIYWCCSQPAANRLPHVLGSNPVAPRLGASFGGTALDTATELKAQLESVTGQSYTLAQLGPSDPIDAGIYVVNPHEWSALHGALPVPSEVTAPPRSIRSAYSLNWASDASWMWILGRDHGLANGTYDYLRRVGYRSLLPGANWQLAPQDASHVEQNGASPGVVLPELQSFNFAGSGGLKFEGDPNEVPNDPVTWAWSSWLRRNSFPTTNLTPGHAYLDFYLHSTAAIDANPLSLAEVSGVRQTLDHPVTEEGDGATKIHYTGLRTHTASQPGFVPYTFNGVEYWEDHLDYDTANILDTPGPGDTWKRGVLGELAAYAQYKLAAAATQLDNPSADRASVSPSDGGLHCSCPKCQALLQHVDVAPTDFTDTWGNPLSAPPSGPSSISDRVFFATNAVADALAEAYGTDPVSGVPLKGVSLLGYAQAADVPHIPVSSNVMLWLTPHAYQGASTGKTANQLITAWGEKMQHNGGNGPIARGIYDYFSNVNSTWGSIYQNARTLENRVRFWRSAGITDVAIESGYGGAFGPIGLLGARMAWSSTETAASMLDGFVADAFGQGQSPSDLNAPAGLKAIREAYATLYEKAFHDDDWDLSILLGYFSQSTLDYVASLPAAEQARFADLAGYVHYLALLPSCVKDHDCEETYKWIWCIDGNLMLPTNYLSNDVLQKREQRPEWLLPTAFATAAAHQAGCVSPLAAVTDDITKYPRPPGNEVEFATDTSDYMLLPPIDALPTSQTSTAPLEPAPFVGGNNYRRYLFVVPATQSVTITVNVPPNTPDKPLTIDVTDFAGESVASVSLLNPGSVNAPEDVPLGTLAPGNYEVSSFSNVTAGYSLTATTNGGAVGVPLAFMNGVQTNANTNFWFYVPAEVDSVFIRGVDNLYWVHAPRDGTGNRPELWHSTDGVTEPVSHSPRVSRNGKTVQLDTSGRPGLWKVVMIAKQGAHLVNVPDVFSLDPAAVITSKRIRTAMVPYAAGPSTVPITSPTLKYNNRFNVRLPAALAAGQPLLTIGSGTALSSPPAIQAQLLDAEGNELPGSPYEIVPGAATPFPITSTLPLPAGDYELRIINPSIYNGYAPIIPAGLSFVSVDGFGWGNAYHPSYRQVFIMPGRPVDMAANVVRYVDIVARPTGPEIAVYRYNSDGSEVFVGNPTSMLNNVWQIAIPAADDSTADTLWALNMKGDYWSDIRLLNAPQMMSTNKKLLMVKAPPP